MRKELHVDLLFGYLEYFGAFERNQQKKYLSVKGERNHNEMPVPNVSTPKVVLIPVLPSSHEQIIKCLHSYPIKSFCLWVLLLDLNRNNYPLINADRGIQS